MAGYLVTGCSGGGKSTLIDALAARGFHTVAEPGRRLIAQDITPWDEAERFLRAAADMARADLADHASATQPVFHDRGLIDALAGLERLGLGSVRSMLGSERPYEAVVFLAPPWREIFHADSGRRHVFDEAMKEYRHLARLVAVLGYRPLVLPKTSVAGRVQFVMDAIRP